MNFENYFQWSKRKQGNASTSSMLVIDDSIDISDWLIIDYSYNWLIDKRLIIDNSIGRCGTSHENGAFG